MMKQKRRITKSYFDFACKKYAPLIQKLSFRMSTNELAVDELKSRAMEELLKCMICYDGRGCFMTFFFGRLSNIFRHMRDVEKRAKRISSMSLDLMSNIAGPSFNTEEYMSIQELIDYLNEEERLIIMKIFFEGKTIRDTSLDCGIVPSAICRIKNRAIDKMRQKCGLFQG